MGPLFRSAHRGKFNDFLLINVCEVRVATVTPVSFSPHPSCRSLSLTLPRTFRVPALVRWQARSCPWIVSLSQGRTQTRAGHPVVHTRGIAATHRSAERETICQSINFYRRSRRVGEKGAPEVGRWVPAAETELNRYIYVPVTEGKGWR